MIASLRTRATPDSTVQETQRRPLGCSVGTCASRELRSSRVLTGAHAINPDQVRRDPGSTWLGRAQRRFLRFSALSDADVRAERSQPRPPTQEFQSACQLPEPRLRSPPSRFPIHSAERIPRPGATLQGAVPGDNTLGRRPDDKAWIAWNDWLLFPRQGGCEIRRSRDGVTRPPPRYKEGRLIEATQLRWCSSIPDGSLAR